MAMASTTLNLPVLVNLGPYDEVRRSSQDRQPRLAQSATPMRGTAGCPTAAASMSCGASNVLMKCIAAGLGLRFAATRNRRTGQNKRSIAVKATGFVCPPTAALCPPGKCVFTADWSAAKLIERVQLSHDTILVTFQLPDESKPLGLSTCACILAKFNEEGSPDPIVRPYTPVSTNAMLGSFQLVIKVYPGGKFSSYINQLPLGTPVDFKHIDKNVKIQYPFGKKHITMLTGGTGITPIIQALHAILGTEGDDTQVTVLFGNKTQKDILCKELLDAWTAKFPGRLNVVHVLSEAQDDATWTGAKGFIGKDLIAAHCAPPSADSLIIVCGPPPMYTALCGPRDKPEELTGLLSEMGYAVEQVFKF